MNTVASCLPLAVVAAFAFHGTVALVAGSGQLPVEVAEVDVRPNITYYSGEGADKYRHRLDLYLPKGRKNVPSLMFVHGGGWTEGIKDQYAPIGRFFAEHGIATAVINYRLAPRIDHPGQVQDVARAFAWMHAHVAEYGGSANRIFVAGHSAGGHLVALLATDRTYTEAVGLSVNDIAGVIPISGAYTLTRRSGLFSGRVEIDAESVRAASPIAHVAGGLAPFLILYGDGDASFSRGDAEKMAQALETAGTPVEVHELANHNHMQMVLAIVSPGDPGAAAILEFITRKR